MSVKEMFFPPTEQLMLIEKIGNQLKLTETLPDEKRSSSPYARATREGF
jgi:hypothetical protein